MVDRKIPAKAPVQHRSDGSFYKLHFVIASKINNYKPAFYTLNSNMSDEKVFPIMTKRHSRTHMLAQAVQRHIDPTLQLGTGPALENWFYYDIGLTSGIECWEEELKMLTKQMRQMVKERQQFRLYTCSLQEGYLISETTGQRLKLELLDKLKEKWETQVTYYINTINEKAFQFLKDCKPWYKERCESVTHYFSGKLDWLDCNVIVFVDLCAWPHVDDTVYLEPSAMLLDKIAGAYRQADEKNQMMTRLYGIAFDTKEELESYQTMMEEARKRDHRVLGKKLNLFSFSDMVGAGFPLLQPKWMIIRQEIEKYLWELHQDKGYQRVRTPHLAKTDLYKCSGHYELYKENFQVKWKEEDFMVKPMNCPHHMQIFAANQFSYRDMPVRYFEPATVYRDEKSWQLSGLTRVRAITQDDWHLFCRVGQITQEVSTIVSIISEFYGTLGMINDYRVSLSVRDNESDKYLGSHEVREKAESALQKAADANNLPYKRIEGEAAFYGPKLDFMFKDAIGRERQLATIQCDFNLPERFDLSFINEEGEKERPVVIHRAISGSLERFMWVMIEHFAGAFPIWLAPIQVRVVPVAEAFQGYAHEVSNLLKKSSIRSEVDDSSDSFAKKIRNGEMLRIPYLLVVWEQEQKNRSVNARSYKTKQQEELSLYNFVEQLSSEYLSRSL